VSSNSHFQRQAAASRERQFKIIKATPKRVEGDDEGYQSRRAEIAVLRIYARRYPEILVEMYAEVVVK
jgi:hypothetical protein